MSKETILILDKEAHTQWTLKTLLESEKYIALAVNSIERAFQNFQEFEVSCLITEFWVDNNCTSGMIQELKRRFPELYVMMLTHENLEETEYRKIMIAGADDFFLKPVSSVKILVHLNKGLKHRKILLQKKRLEQILDEIKANPNTQDFTLAAWGVSDNK